MTALLINTQIAKFYISGNLEQVLNEDVFFCTNKTLKFKELMSFVFNGSISVEALDTFQYEDFLRCFERLLPVFLTCNKVCDNVVLESLNLSWLGYNYKFIQEPKNKDETGLVELVLLLTSLLENALVNVYLTVTEKRAAPPHLLKDLISTNELRTAIGAETILFLKILLGTPKSINLRNIVWHGFPTPQDLPPHYASVLLLTIHTLGCILQEQRLTIQLHSRAPIRDFTRYLSKIESAHKCSLSAGLPLDKSEGSLNAGLPLDETKAMHDALSSCVWLSDKYKVYWQRLARHFRDGKYWQMVVLILPQIELLLRLIYGHANGYDVSAKLDELYITLETIFENSVPGSPTHASNKLLSGAGGLGAGALECIYDLFAAPNGPRLRDKVSHGEVIMDAVNNAALCRHLLRLSMQLLATRHARPSAIDSYKSCFHPNALAKEALHAAKVQLQHLIEFNGIAESPQSCVPEEVEETLWADLKRVAIFERPKREAELVNLILRISHCITQAAHNYEESIRTRATLLAQRELHSKRRRTFERLCATLPQVTCVLFEIVRCASLVFLKLQQDHVQMLCDAEKVESVLRFLKHTLKMCENFAKYAYKDSNEWIKALELCEKFNVIRLRYLALD